MLRLAAVARRAKACAALLCQEAGPTGAPPPASVLVYSDTPAGSSARSSSSLELRTASSAASAPSLSAQTESVSSSERMDRSVSDDLSGPAPPQSPAYSDRLGPPRPPAERRASATLSRAPPALPTAARGSTGQPAGAPVAAGGPSAAVPGTSERISSCSASLRRRARIGSQPAPVARGAATSAAASTSPGLPALPPAATPAAAPPAGQASSDWAPAAAPAAARVCLSHSWRMVASRMATEPKQSACGAMPRLAGRWRTRRSSRASRDCTSYLKKRKSDWSTADARRHHPPVHRRDLMRARGVVS
mmetsp:Transcript_28312/g.90255  ORF Transcript_28312/g.90255 Transcript_28312/m.90255 type:complete len:305 (-) Transcript_28312:1720-2634(-)